MTLYFGNTEVTEGIDCLRYGSKIIDKLYFKDNLIYQNMLTRKTLLWNGNYKFDTSGKYITLDLVKKDWSNLSGIIVSVSGYIFEFDKDLIKKAQTMSNDSGIIMGQIRRMNDNVVFANSGTGTHYLTAIWAY